LGLPGSAEGVETAEELSFLGREGCGEAQGYLLGRPEPISALTSLILGGVAGPSPATAAG